MCVCGLTHTLTLNCVARSLRSSAPPTLTLHGQVTIDISGDAELMAWKEEKERARKEQEVSLSPPLACLSPLLRRVLSGACDLGSPSPCQVRSPSFHVAWLPLHALHLGVLQLVPESLEWLTAVWRHGRPRWKPRCRPGWPLLL